MGEGRRIRKTRKGGFGKFILGWFLGFVCTLLLIVGLGFWAYNSISIRKIEKWTKTEIINNEGIENKSIKEWTAIASSLFKKDSSAYTIAQFEEDFGIELIQGSIYGIDLTPVKNSPLSNIKEGLDTAIDSATFNNILAFMEITDDQLGLLNTVLNKELTYYISGQKLYTSDSYSTEADFEYTVDKTNNVVKFSNGSHTISSGVIKPRLADLPLNTAMERIQEVTNDLAIYEVLGYTREGPSGNYVYKDKDVKVTGMLATLAGYSVGDLSKNETFNGLYIYEVMGYYYNEIDKKYYEKYDSSTDTYTNEVTGVLKYLAPSSIERLTSTINSLTLGQALDIKFEDASGILKVFYDKPINDLDEEIKNIKVYQAMGYYYNEIDKKYYNTFDGTNYSDEVILDGIVKAIANTPVNSLSQTIKDLKAKDVFDREETAVLNLFVTDNEDGTENTTELDNLTVMDLPSAVVNKINNPNTTLGDLLDAEVITMDNPPAEDDPVRLLTIAGLIEFAMTKD